MSEENRHSVMGRSLKSKVVMATSVAGLIAMACAVLRRRGLSSIEPQAGTGLNLQAEVGTWEGFYAFPQGANNRPCVGVKGQFWGEVQRSEGHCAASCLSEQTCKFVAWCKEDVANQKCDAKMCMKYTACDGGNLAQTYEGYTLYAKEGAVPHAYAGATTTAAPGAPSEWSGFENYLAPGLTDPGTAAPSHAGVCPERQVISGETVATEGACAASCLLDPSCQFASYCAASCLAGHSRYCARYRGCDHLDMTADYASYKTYSKEA